MDDKMKWTMTDVQHGCHFFLLNVTVFPNEAFSLCSCLQHYNSDFGPVEQHPWHSTRFVNFPLHLYICCRDKHTLPYRSFTQWWISIGLFPLLTKNWISERFSSYMHPSNRACFFGRSADMKAALQHLSYTVHASNECWWFDMHTVAHSRISVFFALRRFSFASPSYIINLYIDKLIWRYIHS
jgi:hypothetical protein